MELDLDLLRNQNKYDALLEASEVLMQKQPNAHVAIRLLEALTIKYGIVGMIDGLTRIQTIELHEQAYDWINRKLIGTWSTFHTEECTEEQYNIIMSLLPLNHVFNIFEPLLRAKVNYVMIADSNVAIETDVTINISVDQVISNLDILMQNNNSELLIIAKKLIKLAYNI